VINLDSWRYALDFAILNLGSETAWGNLGYWAETKHYPTACRALAHQVGQELQSSDQVLDVGIGAGQQLIEWQQHFGVKSITGIELSPRHFRFAQQRIQHHNIQATLYNINANDITNWHADQFDRVISLDSAYHYRTRQAFFHAANHVLRPDGVLSLADMYLSDDISSWGYQALRAVTPFASIPKDNLMRESDYFNALQQSGFKHIQIRDVTSEVLGGFGEFSNRHWQQYRRQTLLGGWAKILFTGWLCRRNMAWGGVRYGIITAQMT